MFSKSMEQNLLIEKRDFYRNLGILNTLGVCGLVQPTNQSAAIEELFVNSGRKRKLLFFEKYQD